MQSGHDVGLPAEVPGTPRHPDDGYRPYATRGFMRGTRMPVFAKVMPLSSRTASKAAVYLQSRSRIRCEAGLVVSAGKPWHGGCV
jgi:hypothetical protein